ncbi:MAG: ATP-binding protein [Candidatus Buchananbacteria bacterium]
MNSFTISCILTSLISFLMGVFVYAKNKARTNRIWFWLSMVISFWSIGLWGVVASQTPENAMLWQYVLDFGAIFIAPLYLHFILALLSLNKEKRKIIIACYGFSIVLFLLSFTGLFKIGMKPIFGFSYWIEPGPLYFLFPLAFLVFIFYSIFLIIKFYYKVSGYKRQQLRYVLLAGVVGFSGGLTDFFPQLIKFYPIGNYFIVFYVAFIAYAITRYRLMEIKTIIKRSTVFGVLVVVIASAYTLLAIYLTGFLEVFVGTNSVVVTGLITAVLVVLVFQPLKNWLQKVTDRFLFVGAYEPAVLLAKVNEICSSILNLDQLLTSLVQVVKDNLRTSNLAVLLLDKKKQLAIAKKDGWPKEFDKFIAGKEKMLPLYFKNSREIYIIPELKARYESGDYQPKDATFLYELDELNVSLIVPLFTHENLIGVIVFGPKKSGDPYSQEDLNTLGIIAGQAAIAITNTELYEEQRGFAVKLQKEVEKATAELRAANAELKKLDEAKSDFISIASHQLRTPLTVIKGYGSMIKEGSFGKVPKKIMEVVGKMYISNDRLIDLVENLLNISRIESGRLEFNLEKMDLADLAKEVFEELSQKAAAKKLDYQLSVEKKLPPIMADRNRLHDVVSNLIDNAIKYTPSGQVKVFARLEQGQVLFEVIDTGSGVDPKDLPHLFQKFTRGQGAFQIHTEGVGLGLYVAKMMMDKMQGKIWAESAGLNKGSRFVFTIPPSK